jgi:hypothetical protein
MIGREQYPIGSGYGWGQGESHLDGNGQAASWRFECENTRPSTSRKIGVKLFDGT